MTIFKNYLDKEITELQENSSEGAGPAFFVRFGTQPNLTPSSATDVWLPLFYMVGNMGGVNAVVAVGAGGYIQAAILGVDGLDVSVTLPYAEMYVYSLDGTEALGVEADNGLILPGYTWTDQSEFGAAGTDLSSDVNGKITSTAGGVFAVRFSVMAPA